MKWIEWTVITTDEEEVESYTDKAQAEAEAKRLNDQLPRGARDRYVVREFECSDEQLATAVSA